MLHTGPLRQSVIYLFNRIYFLLHTAEPPVSDSFLMEGKPRFFFHKWKCHCLLISRCGGDKHFASSCEPPPQMTCPTSSVSLSTRTRPSFRSTPSRHCRFDASAWIMAEFCFVFVFFNLVHFTESDKVEALLARSRLVRSSVGNAEQRWVIFKWWTDFNFGWALVLNTCSQCHSFTFWFFFLLLWMVDIIRIFKRNRKLCNIQLLRAEPAPPALE